jgi:hypothetical protein
LPKPLKEFVQQVLGERNRGTKIRQALDYGAALVAAQDGNGWWRRKSTRRAIFWENAVNKLIELLADDTGVQIVFHHDTVSFVFEDAVLLRLKKADYTLRTSNIPTFMAQLFDDHEVDLFGYPGLQRVEAVYIPNRYDTGIVYTGLVAREDGVHLWHCDLPEPATASVPALPQPVSPPAASLAKLKNQNNDRKRKNGDE